MRPTLSAQHDLLAPPIFEIEVAAALARSSLKADDANRLMAVPLARAQDRW
jgi:hypothetical protein